MILRSGVLGELVTVASESGLMLDGLLFEAVNAAAIVVHVHGSYGNFYQAAFLRTFARRYVEQGISVLALNTSGRDGFGEGNFESGQFLYIGGAVSEFSCCVQDIGAMVAFASELSSRVILQGHSLGCDRILHYAVERGSSNDMILLAPCDSYALHRRWLGGEAVESQIQRLRREARDAGLDWIGPQEYGVRQSAGWDYTLPVTRRAFLSIADGPPFKLINIHSPTAYYLPVRAAVYVGGRDVLQTSPSAVMFEYLGARFTSVLPLFDPQGDHMLVGCEQRVADALVDWLLRSAS